MGLSWHTWDPEIEASYSFILGENSFIFIILYADPSYNFTEQSMMIIQDTGLCC